MKSIDDFLNSLNDNIKEKPENLEVSKERTESYTDEFLLTNVKTYDDVCKYLKEEAETNSYLQIKQIAKLFNGDWKPVFGEGQRNYYPYFDCYSGGFGFYGSLCNSDDFYGMVSYYKNKEISDFVGKTFKDVYEKLLTFY